MKTLEQFRPKLLATAVISRSCKTLVDPINVRIHAN